jgi:uncharacterized protein YdaU (DUF1376 family)
MKDPAFLFYPNDYIGGTMGMTLEEKGAYIELLMMQFNRGHMTSHMVGQVVGQIWDNIKHKFKQDENELWYNERLELEINKRKAYTESRKNNINGVNQYTKKVKKKGGHMDGHTTSHMENENEIEDNNINIVFENFRKLYPGTKRGYLTEFENFKKKNKDWKDVLPKLNDSLNEQIKARNRKKSMNGFVPEWKHLQTYLNNRCWEEEITIKNEQTSKSLM